MALGDDRRESGRRMEAARRQLGIDNENARRMLGRQMEAARRGETVVEDIARLTPPPAPRRTLTSVPAVGGIGAQRGRADYNPPRSLGGGGGIASPLIEQPNTRTYHDPVVIPSTDGMAWIKWVGVKKVTMLDAAGATVEMEYLNVSP